MRGMERRAEAGAGASTTDSGSDRPGAGGRSARVQAARTRPWRKANVWVDPRFVLGLMLVLVSIVGVWWLVTTSSRTVPVYAATETLAPGTALDRAKLHVVDIRLGAAESGYLAADTTPTRELIVTRTVAAGELVPVAALDAAASLGITTLVVEPSGRLGADIATGSVVDLWAAAPVADGYGVPEVLVAAATVVRASEEEGFLARGGSTALELALPRSSVADVLAAMAADHLLSVVPTEPGAR